MTEIVFATFNREAFYHRLDRERRNRRTSWRAIGRDTGVASATFTLLGQGHALSLDTLAALLAWLGETDLKPYMTASAGGTKTSNEEA